MAYKFQLGAARLSGSVVQEGDVTAESSQLNAATIDLDDASGIAGAGLEDQSGDLGIADLGVTNAMLAGNIASSKLAELNAFDTGDLAEGSNLYYTQARFDSALAAKDTGDLAEGSNLYYTQARFDAALAAKDTGDLSEGSNLYFTDARARAAVSVTDNGGDGSLSYDSSTGVISYTGPSAAEVRAHLSGGEMIDFASGEMAINSSEFSASAQDVIDASAANVRAHFSVADSTSVDMSLTSGEISAVVLVDDSSIEIDATNGVQVKALGVTNAMLAGAIASSKIAELNAFDTADLAEGSNLYYTDARSRAAVSVTDNGGDGSLSYDSSTGVISYTGPSSAEVRAHLAAADTTSIDMSYNSSTGEFSGVALVDSDALEVVAGGISLKSSIAGARTFQSDVTVSGDLTVAGALTYVNTTNLAISDALITVGSGSSAFAVDYGLEFGAIGSGWASIKTAQENIDDQAGDEDIFKFSHPVSASMMVTEVLSAENIYGDLEGSIIESVQTITAGSQFADQNQQILCNFASDDNLSLPSPSAMEGKVYKFKKIGNGNVEIRPNGSETIDGASSILLESPYAGVSIISDGNNYFVM